MTQLLSSGEFSKLRYDIIPVKNASANVSFYINNSKKIPKFWLVTLLSQMSLMFWYIFCCFHRRAKDLVQYYFVLIFF
jgi:hypothetical protein